MTNYQKPIEHFTQETRNEHNKLTDEEVWLRAYLTAISLDTMGAATCEKFAEDTLDRFRKRFRND